MASVIAGGGELRVGVAGAYDSGRHELLLRALAEAFDVCFERSAASAADGLSAVLAIGAVAPGWVPSDVPCLSVPRADAVERVAWDGSEEVRLSAHDSVPRPLRGRELTERDPARAAPLRYEAGNAVLAETSGDPVWWHAAAASGSGPRRPQVSAYPLPSLTSGSVLREHLRAGRFMGLLPLVSLLQEIRGEHRSGPPLRACVVFDDPNLHWHSYGHIDYSRLVEHARAAGYHVSFATVPLDSWFVNRRAASILRANRDWISLTVHGNDHSAHELGRLTSDREAERSIAQSLRRIASLERRAGMHVDRVMVPPYERCSEQSLRAMLRLGFEAACMSRPHPWRDGEPPASPLLGWRPADFVAGGLPVLPRYPLHFPLEELSFRALLGQPLILYGHHDFLADDYHALGQLVEHVNSLGHVRWMSLGQIARSNYERAAVRDELVLELGCLRADVDVPERSRHLTARVADAAGGARWAAVRGAGRTVPISRLAHRWQSDRLPVPGGSRIELELLPERVLEPRLVAAPRPRAWPFVRRIGAEQRARLTAMAAARSRRSAGGAQPQGPHRIVMLLENNPYPHDTRVRNEAETLAAEGRDVTVIAPRGPGQTGTEVVEAVRVRRFRCPTSAGSVRALALEYAVAHFQLMLRGTAELLRGAQALHFHGPPDTLALGGLAARLLGRSVVFDLHDSAPELFTAKFGPSSMRTTLVAAQRAAIWCASRVIVTNESQRDLVLDRGLGRPRVQIVRNGPRAAEFGPDPIPARPGKLSDPRLVYVGTLGVQDGVLDLVDLLKNPELDHVTLTIVGDGPAAPELRSRVAEAGLGNRITFTGRVAHERVPELIAECDIGIDPAPGTELNHGSTMIKIAEYLAAGRPVVAYRLVETERTATDAALYARCGDPDEFARLISDLAADSERRIALGRRARERGLQLAWEHSAAALRDLYAELV